MAVDRFYNPFGNTGSYLEKSNEKIRRGRPFQMVLPLGHLDVFLLHHICARFVEEAKEDMELAPVPGLKSNYHNRTFTTKIELPNNLFFCISAYYER